MQTAIIPVTPFQQNCSIIWCTKTMKGAVVDPGGNLDRILMVAAEKQVT
ncbi:MAG: MBL fold metallo-hydrolase, partial [Rhodospirillaceae bacterium]|nr:MBL fold metallo-hydrolase [Rhodospirillaceae bacterium]